MPIVEVHLLEGYSDDAKTRLGEALTDAVRLVVPADPDAVTVMLHEMPRQHYMRGRTQRDGASALPDPCALIATYLGAMEARDLHAAQSMLGDGFQMYFPGAPAMTALTELVDWARDRYAWVKKRIDRIEALKSGDATVVYCTGTLYGEWPDGSAFDGIRFIDRFEIAGDRIIRQDVWNDIAEVRGKP